MYGLMPTSSATPFTNKGKEPNEPLEYHILQPIGQLPKKVSHGPLGPN